MFGKLTWLVATAAIAIAICVTIRAVYNIFFHPLAKFPGPWWLAANVIPRILMVFGGRPHERLLQLHRQYGETIRIAPGELSSIAPDAWSEFMNVRSGVENNKDPSYVDPKTGSIISVAKADHARIRKILSDGFSGRRIHDYQEMLQKHASSLIANLQRSCENGKTTINLVDWYNFVLIDMVYELTLGSPFGCLETQQVPPCVDFAFSRAKLGAYIGSVLRLPAARLLLALLVPRSVVEDAQRYQDHLKEQVNQRLKSPIQHTHFVGRMLTGKDELSMSIREIYTNTEVLIIGGSETTASGLCAATFFLASHPSAMQKVTNEIFAAFQCQEDIDMVKVSRLPFVRAVIYESLRLYPPSPAALPRKTPAGGNRIFGKQIPGDTILGIWQWVANHSERNFKQPFDFVPERWLNADGFQEDRRDVFHPFSFGPRNCIGQNLATYQLSLILTRMLWNFDIRLAEESRTWLDQDVYILWQKKPLYVYITPRSTRLRTP